MAENESRARRGDALRRCRREMPLRDTHGLANKTFGEVPAQELGVGPLAVQLGYNGERLVVQAVIGLAVEVLLLDAVAHPHPQLGRHGHQSGIEELVEVGTQQHYSPKTEPAPAPPHCCIGAGAGVWGALRLCGAAQYHVAGQAFLVDAHGDDAEPVALVGYEAGNGETLVIAAILTMVRKLDQSK